jgi:hypothetical protein
MAREINILEVYRNVFGYIGQPYFTANPKSYVPLINLDKNEAVDITERQYSLLGTPIFLPCKLEGIELPNEPIIQISGSKTIIKTQIDGQDGTFKELYSLNDYQVTIRGVVTNEENDDYPEDIIRKIRTICELKKSVTIINALTSLFDINKIAIESFSFPAVEGQISMQAYEINASSDRDFELKIKTAG